MTDTSGNEAIAAAPETNQAAEAAPDPVAELAKEAAGLKDRLLRTLAEMENLRRRTEREVADARLQRHELRAPISWPYRRRYRGEQR